jgi:hypothetical protein
MYLEFLIHSFLLWTIIKANNYVKSCKYLTTTHYQQVKASAYAMQRCLLVANKPIFKNITSGPQTLCDRPGKSQT